MLLHIAEGGQHEPDWDADNDHHDQRPIGVEQPTPTHGTPANCADHQGQRNHKHYAAEVHDHGQTNERTADHRSAPEVPGNRFRDDDGGRRCSRGEYALAPTEGNLCDTADQNQVGSRPRSVLKA